MIKNKFTNLFPNIASVNTMFENIDGIFDEARTALDGPHWQEVKTSFTKAPVDYDISSDELSHILTVVVPGLTKEEVSVTVSDGKLNVKIEAGESLWARSTDRKFTLPEDSSLENIVADVKNGILTVKILRTTEKVEEIKVL
jgi:HSP20 family molecular chaperone IbpA